MPKPILPVSERDAKRLLFGVWELWAISVWGKDSFRVEGLFEVSNHFPVPLGLVGQVSHGLCPGSVWNKSVV